MKYEAGVFAKYVALVGSAAEGAVTSRPTFCNSESLRNRKGLPRLFAGRPKLGR